MGGMTMKKREGKKICLTHSLKTFGDSFREREGEEEGERNFLDCGLIPNATRLKFYWRLKENYSQRSNKCGCSCYPKEGERERKDNFHSPTIFTSQFSMQHSLPFSINCTCSYSTLSSFSFSDRGAKLFQTRLGKGERERKRVFNESKNRERLRHYFLPVHSFSSSSFHLICIRQESWTFKK